MAVESLSLVVHCCIHHTSLLELYSRSIRVVFDTLAGAICKTLGPHWPQELPPSGVKQVPWRADFATLLLADAM